MYLYAVIQARQIRLREFYIHVCTFTCIYLYEYAHMHDVLVCYNNRD